MAHGMLLSLRLFLEGIEVDVVSAQVAGGLNQSAQAQIEIPHAVASSNILPRTLVHLFFLQTHYESDKQVNGTHVSAADETDPKQWKLLFAGEVVSISFALAGGSRSNHLICQDFSSYWQAAQLYWGTGSNSSNSHKKVMMMGATQITTGKSNVQNGGALADILAAKPTSIPALSGVLGGIVSLLEASTGVYGSAKYRGVNDFMSQAEVRLHLSRLIGAHAADDTSSVFLQYGDLRSYFRRLTSAVRSTASFMDLAGTFLSKIHHVWASVPAPPYIEAGSAATTTQVVSIKQAKSANDKELELWYKRIKETHDHLGRRHEELVVAQEAAKAANGTPGSSFKTPDYATLKDDLVRGGLYDGKTAKLHTPTSEGFTGNQNALKDLSVRLSQEATAKKKTKHILNTTEALAKAADAIYDLRQLGTADDKGAYLAQTPAAVTEAQKKLAAAMDGIHRGTGATTKVVTKSVVLDSRLNMFLFMPDLYMVPPPKCNVLFPEQYMSLSFSRSWLSEVTRLWMFGQTTAGSETSVGYFSPNTAILKGPKAVDSASAAQAGLSFLMAHEVYSGPIPSLESIGDIAVFKRIHNSQVATAKKEDKGKVGDPTGSQFSGQARYSPQEHLQRAANYQFFAKRFEGRSMQISAKFSPQVVPGLSMLVLDPPVGPSSLQTGEVSTPEQRGQHYVGLVASVQHSISSSGAGTSITLVKCRYHNEGLDLFAKDGNVVDTETGQLLYKKRIVKYRVAKPSKRKNVLIQPVFGAGAAGRGEEGRSNASTWMSSTLTARQRLDYAARVESPGVGYIVESTSYGTTAADREAVTTVYKNEKTKATLTVVVKAIHDEDTDASLSSVPKGEGIAFVDTVDFEVEKKASSKAVVSNKDLQFTFEGTATPPWFASIYLPSRIGKEYYQVILGCGSVVDDALFEATKNSTDDKVLVQLPTADGTKEVPIPAEFTLPAVSTHDAAEQLADAWKGLKETGANLPLFIDTYGARKYASLLDILGEANPWLRSKIPLPPASATATKVDGFHGNAYGAIDGMKDIYGAGLDEEPTIPRLSPQGVKPPTLRNISPGADPRKERYTRVVAYANEVSRTRSSLGGK